MLGVYAILIVALAAALGPEPRLQPRTRSVGTVSAALYVPLVAGIVAATYWHERLVALAAATQRPLPAWASSLPVVPIFDRAPLHGHVSGGISASVELLSCAEAALLVCVAYVSRDRRLSIASAAVIAAGVAALLIIALRSHGILSMDVYAYVAYGLLGTAAYHPVDAPFAGSLHAIVQLWGDPPLPCIYGPSWLLPATVLMHGVHALSDGVMRFRLLGVASVFAVLMALVRLRVPLAVWLTFLLNPFVWMQYVADAHNELWPVVFVLLGRSCAERPAAAAFFAGLAGAAKLPFVAIGVIVGAGRADRSMRLRTAAAGTGIALLLSLAFGGAAYVRALITVAHAYRMSTEAQAVGVHALALIASSIALTLVLAGRRSAWPASFSFIGMGSGVFPWYAGWGLPYATLCDGAELFLCALPVVAFLASTSYVPTPLWRPLLTAVAVVAGVAAYRFLRARCAAWIPGHVVRLARPSS